MKKEEYVSVLCESLDDILNRIDDQDTKVNVKVFKFIELKFKTYGDLCLNAKGMTVREIKRSVFLGVFEEFNHPCELSIDNKNSILKIETAEQTISFNYKLPREFTDIDGVLFETKEKDVLFMLAVSAIAQTNYDMLVEYQLSDENLRALKEFIDRLGENESTFELFYNFKRIDGVLLKEFKFGNNEVLLHDNFGVSVVFPFNAERDFDKDKISFFNKMILSPENFYYLTQTFGDNEFILKSLWLFDLISGSEYKLKDFYRNLISSKDFTKYLKKTNGIDLCDLDGLRDGIISLFDAEGVKENPYIHSKLLELRNHQGDICETLYGDLTFALSVVSLYCANQDVEYDITKFLTLRDEASSL